MRIGEIGERKLIEMLAAEVFSGQRDNLPVGIGDDAALTVPTPGKLLVTTKDMLVEEVHFLRRAITPFDLGYKSLAVNLSDIAAMGGAARHAYVALALPAELTVEYVLDFYRGMKELAGLHGVSVAGGDTVGSPGPLVISVTVQGEVDKDKALLRSGASPGDILCTTGALGASAAGLSVILGGLDCPPQEKKQALRAHLRPVPRLREAAFLAAASSVSAAIDLSDGLIKDTGEICQQSGCGALLYADRLPVHPAAVCIAALQGQDPLDVALNGGEDYELLLTVPPKAFLALGAAYFRNFGTRLLPLGEITATEGIFMITKEGNREKITFKGFRHF